MPRESGLPAVFFFFFRGRKENGVGVASTKISWFLAKPMLQLLSILISRVCCFACVKHL